MFFAVRAGDVRSLIHNPAPEVLERHGPHPERPRHLRQVRPQRVRDVHAPRLGAGDSVGFDMGEATDSYQWYSEASLFCSCLLYDAEEYN